MSAFSLRISFTFEFSTMQQISMSYMSIISNSYSPSTSFGTPINKQITKLLIKQSTSTYCWWLKSCTTWDASKLVNNGIKYHINWWSPDFWTINSITYPFPILSRCLYRNCPRFGSNSRNACSASSASFVKINWISWKAEKGLQPASRNFQQIGCYKNPRIMNQKREHLTKRVRRLGLWVNQQLQFLETIFV